VLAVKGLDPAMLIEGREDVREKRIYAFATSDCVDQSRAGRRTSWHVRNRGASETVRPVGRRSLTLT
jgi:hypothetical protein